MSACGVNTTYADGQPKVLRLGSFTSARPLQCCRIPIRKTVDSISVSVLPILHCKLILIEEGIWSAMRNTGSVIGGAINFSTNYDRAGSGGIAWKTYLIFVGFGKLYDVARHSDANNIQNVLDSYGRFFCLQLQKYVAAMVAKFPCLVEGHGSRNLLLYGYTCKEIR